MSVLLREIRSIKPAAASVLEQAKLCTDSEIQSLTRDELHELFPGPEQLKLRRDIFEIIHKQKPIDLLISELKDFIPHESFRAALTDNGVLVDYLRILKDMEAQTNCVQSFLDAHIGLLEEFSKNQPDQESGKGTSTSASCDPEDPGGHQQAAQGSILSMLSPRDFQKGEVMSVLLREIRSIKPAAASVLEQANFCTDSEIQSLTRDELRELFPGPEQLKLRRDIFEIIHKQKPIDLLISELKDFIPHESFRAALTDNGVLVDYLRILKDMEAQTNCVQSFLDAHIGLLEEFSKNQPDQESGKGVISKPTAERTSSHLALTTNHSSNGQTGGHQQAAQDSLPGPAACASGHKVPDTGPTGDHPHGFLRSILSMLSPRDFQKGEVMSVLLREIRSIKPAAASVLEQAKLCTDSEIQSLTRDELHELFPGPEQLKLRRDIFEIIHKQKPIDLLISNTHESFRAALTDNGVLVDYLRILKDMKAQMNCVLDAHIGLLEEFSKNQPDQESGKGVISKPTAERTSSHLALTTNHSSNGQTGGHQQAAQDSLPGPAACASGHKVPDTGPTGDHPHGSHRDMSSMLSPRDFQKVKYKMVVSGKTFGAEEQLMEKVMRQGQDWVQFQMIRSSEDYQIIIVFCPISSRIASDVDAAMTDVKDDKPVILVLMHHAREVKCTTSMRTWPHDFKVVLFVNVFYHETTHGLLKCGENDAAVSQIRNKLLQYSIQRRSGIGSGSGF